MAHPTVDVADKAIDMRTSPQHLLNRRPTTAQLVTAARGATPGDMRTNVVSAQVGKPQELAWGSRDKVTSGITKTPIEGPLVVRKLGIDGDGFANKVLHGRPDRVLYVLGKSQADAIMERLGRNPYVAGSLGENLLVASLDESKISVGDVFLFGSVRQGGVIDGVVARVTGPRFPCKNVNYALQDKQGVRALTQQPTGVYFEILKPGKIPVGSEMRRIDRPRQRMALPEMFELVTHQRPVTQDALDRAKALPGFPAEFMLAWSQALLVGSLAALVKS